MHTSAHILIAEAVADALNFPEKWKRILSEASIEPDRHRGNKRHHDDNRDLIRDYVISAREYYLKKNIEMALKELGYALHYIQDMFVDIALHNYIERRILSISTSILIEVEQNGGKITHPLITNAIKKGLQESKCSYVYVLSKIYTVKPQRNPEKALSLACEYSVAIVNAVINRDKPPAKLIKNAKKLEESYKVRILIFMIMLVSTLVSMFGIVIISCSGYISGICVAMSISTLTFLFILQLSFIDELIKKYLSLYPRTICEYIWFKGKFARYDMSLLHSIKVHSITFEKGKPIVKLIYR